MSSNFVAICTLIFVINPFVFPFWICFWTWCGSTERLVHIQGPGAPPNRPFGYGSYPILCPIEADMVGRVKYPVGYESGMDRPPPYLNTQPNPTRTQFTFPIFLRIYTSHILLSSQSSTQVCIHLKFDAESHSGKSFFLGFLFLSWWSVWSWYLPTDSVFVEGNGYPIEIYNGINAFRMHQVVNRPLL